MGTHNEERIFSKFTEFLGVGLYFLAVGILSTKLKKLF